MEMVTDRALGLAALNPSYGLLIGVVLVAVGVVIEARRRSDLDIFPDCLIFVGGSVAMWMAAKLFWMDEPPQWFGFFVTLGWLVMLAITMNLLRRGVLL